MAKTFFKCQVCGDIHYGENPPETCPTCKQKNVYESMEKEKALEEMQ